MGLKRDSLKIIQERTEANYFSLFKPLDKTPRHNLLKVLAAVDAGIYHQLLGDLDHLSQQIFPDTASSENLREHWSTRVPPLHASASFGAVVITGVPGLAVPAGLVFSSSTGERYFTEKQYQINSDGIAIVNVRSNGFGTKTNLLPGTSLKIASAVPSGIDSTAEVTEDGVLGGADGETDEEYLARVLVSLRNQSPYGKDGDFAKWAIDSTAEVSAAWEFSNFGVFGALLIQVINGNQTDGVYPVNNLHDVTTYINANAPKITFTVCTPQIIALNPVVELLPQEDSVSNRELAENRMRAFLQLTAKPGYQATAGALRDSIVDGVTISDATVYLNGSHTGKIPTTILQYPYLGVVTWQ